MDDKKIDSDPPKPEEPELPDVGEPEKRGKDPDEVEKKRRGGVPVVAGGIRR